MTPNHFFESEAVTAPTVHGWRAAFYRNFPRILFFLDLLVVVGMFVLAFVLRVGWDVITPDLMLSTAIPGAVIFVALYTIDGYSEDRSFREGAYAVEHSVAIAMAYLLALAVSEFFRIEALGGVESRAAGMMGFGFAGAGTLITRRLLGRIVLDQAKARTLCVFGEPKPVGQLLRDLEEAREPRRIIAVLPDETDDVFPEKCEVRFSPDAAEAIAGLPSSCDEIVVAGEIQRFDQNFVRALVGQYLRGVTVFEIDRFYEHRFNRVWLSSVSHSWLLDGELVLRRHVAWARAKRLFDIAIAGILVVALLPVMAVVALVIALESRGPVFFRQSRMGLDGAPFTMYKFRTMAVGAEHAGLYTEPDDARVTRIGRVIRRRRLDELPQLWNVIRGDMSLVGPRAEALDLIKAYENQIPFYHFRHVLRPGVTGLAQIRQGYASSPSDAVRKLEYDLYYVRHYNILLDLRLMLRTLHVIVRGEGR